MNYGKCTSEQLLEAMRELQKENSILEEASVKNLAETSHIQKALDESKEKYNFLFANNPQPMLIYDLTTLAILEVNQAIVDHYGYSRDEFLLMTIKDIRPAEDIPELLKDLEIARLTNNPLNEWRHKKKNGEIIFVEITAYSVEYKGRKARHVLVHDITRQMSAQVDGNKAVESLRNERLLLRTLIDNIPDSIYCKDVACRKTLVNLAELRFMGAKSESEVLGKDDFDFYPRELAEKFYADDQSVIQTGKPVLNREEYVLDETGQKIWLLSSKLPLRDKDGHIIGLVGMGRNITDRKRVEEDLKENEERHRTILQTAMDGFLLVDTKGKMLEVNSTNC